MTRARPWHVWERALTQMAADVSILVLEQALYGKVQCEISDRNRIFLLQKTVLDWWFLAV